MGKFVEMKNMIMGVALKIKLRILIKLLFFAATLLFLVNQQVKAQDEFDVLLESGAEDVEKYMGNYFEPIFKGIGFDLANGWNNTAKAHKPGGFDITITGNVAFVSNEDLTFAFRNADYNNLRLADGSSSTELPTIVGPKTSNALEIVVVDDNDIPTGAVVNVDALSGLNLKEEIGHNIVPLPMINLSVGLPKQTEIKIRYSPKVNVDDFSGNVTGFGLLHSIKQWLPGMSESKLEISGFIGYTNIKASYALKSTPFNNGTDDQLTRYEVNALTIQGLVSQAMVDTKLFELTLYGGVGFNSVKSNFSILGTYDLDNTVNPVIDPVNLDFSNGGLRFTGGLRLKLLTFLTLHADYTIQEYQALTAGIGINIK